MLIIELKKKQWGRVSEILGNLGVTSVASIVIPFLLAGLDLTWVVLGLILAVGLWYYSIIYAGKS